MAVDRLRSGDPPNRESARSNALTLRGESSRTPSALVIRERAPSDINADIAYWNRRAERAIAARLLRTAELLGTKRECLARQREYLTNAHELYRAFSHLRDDSTVDPRLAALLAKYHRWQGRLLRLTEELGQHIERAVYGVNARARSRKAQAASAGGYGHKGVH